MSNPWGMLVPGGRPELVGILPQNLVPLEDQLVALGEES